MQDRMLFHRQAHALQPSPELHPSQPLRVAVVLNGNAQAVTEALVRELGQVVEHEALFISRSEEQSRLIARWILNRGYDVVVCGGGDGTFSRCVTDILALGPSRAPAFGVLRLGTGNALATTLGASPPNALGLAADLRLARWREAQVALPLLRVEDRAAPFAGIGLDSLILEDYNRTKRLLPPLGAPLTYAVAVATRSFWRFAVERWPTVTLRNEGDAARRIDLDGRPMGMAIPRGAILYQGAAGIAAVSTIPFYGLGLRLFPQALQRLDRFQLRVATVPALAVLTHIGALFRGELDDSRILDFQCTAISITVDRPTALQIGGDEVGRHQEVRVGMTQVRAVSRALASTSAAPSAPALRAVAV
jgi:diacylglycerol kinase family enzyme